MKLKKFRVTHFRSVMDSGWVNCDDVTTLIGINESGKSNILLALWKLKPARGGEIDHLHDLPVTELSKYDKHLEQVSFIEAVFLLDNSAINLRDKVNIDFSEEDEFCIERYYNGKYSWKFTNEEIQKRIEELEKNHIDAEEQSSNPAKEVSYRNGRKTRHKNFSQRRRATRTKEIAGTKKLNCLYPMN